MINGILGAAGTDSHTIAGRAWGAFGEAGQVGFLYGDPAELDRLAGILRARAGAVRQAADGQVSRANAARWASDSARIYRDRLAGKRMQAYRAAEGLDEAAVALGAHARQIRDLLSAIAEAERDVREWFSRKAQEVADAVGPAVARIAHHEVAWSGWPYTPQSLPPPGDKGWLDVGRFMRGEGAL
jgi:hypothetical protein